MTDEINPTPEIQASDVPAPETALQRIEAELEAVKATIEAAPAAVEAEVKAVPGEVVARVHAAIDEFWHDVFTNVSPQIPTTAHNLLSNLKETLRTKLVALF